MEHVLDTSVVIEKIASKLVEKKELAGKLIIPHAVIAELEHQANQGQEIGLIGLEEIQILQGLAKKNLIELEFAGERPNVNQIRYAKSGEIDALIRTIAYNRDATLITADRVLSESAKAFGVKVNFIEPKKPKEKLEMEKFFDNKTMSVHLKENSYPHAKKGEPGNWSLFKIGEKKLSGEKVQEIAKEIVERSRIDQESFVEVSRRGSTIVQYKDYRVIIVKPPVADGWEITIVRPIKKLTLDEYQLQKEIFDRLKIKARGIIISGEVGSGKSTFCQALAEFYNGLGKIVKTVESPRDLQLSEEITQYSKNFASSEEIHDILLLSRPDYIIFDEVRDTPDFHLYSDLRLSGSNVIGVLHAATPIDAVQRFISRLETGMIPSILDTILFIEYGKISKVLSLGMIVKVPSGMVEADLARPVVEVRDFQTNKLEFEIYSYGEETIVVPVSQQNNVSPSKRLAILKIEEELRKFNPSIKAELISENAANIYVPEEDIARVIGKEGKTIDEIEHKLGLHINVKQLEFSKEEIPYKINEDNKFIKFYLDNIYSNKKIDFYIDDERVFTANSGNKAEIKIHKKSFPGKHLINLIDSGKDLKLKI